MPLWAAVAVLATILAGCDADHAASDQSGTLSGQVMVSGPLVGAVVTVDQLDLETGEVYARVGDTGVDIMTDGDGKFFSIQTGVANGLIRITTHGGSFKDLATGEKIQLDATDELISLSRLELLDTAAYALVSPVGHLVEARMRAYLDGSMTASEATEHAAKLLHRHFGNVDWMTVRPVGLELKAMSPTEEVRAALVQASLSFLAKEIAADAHAGAQEVNVYQLVRRWAEDIARPVGEGEDIVSDPFDGNDRNLRTTSPPSLQLGSCPPVEMPCEVPASGCTDGFCRRLCDLYAGTARALLGGMMTRVIRDNGPGGVNQTGLDINNTLAIARSISDNFEPELFGDACIETLDRIPPAVTFQAPGSEVLFVRGTLLVKVAAVDDTDVPRAKIDGYEDTDGDSANAVAQAAIDTTKLPGGMLGIHASASDLSGNVGTATRVVTVDNAEPMLSLHDTGFFQDGATWWTSTATPTLSGEITDDSPIAVELVVAGGVHVPAMISGNTWSAMLASNHLEETGTQVTIVATDAAGNQTIRSQRIRPDAEAPKLSFATSTVIDEATDSLDFSSTPSTPGTDAIPRHMHAGALKNLDTAGSPPMSCPSFTKHTYLLRSQPPAYGTETPSRNPIQYELLVEDVGVGIVDGSIEYRVGRGTGPMTNWILDWTDVGVGIQVGTGLQRFAVGIFSNVVAGLDTAEGLYSVEFRARDRLNRETPPFGRCFDLHLRAPPVRLEQGGGAPSPNPAQSHALALDSLNLAPGSPFDQIAARLLNNGAHASILEQSIINGTAESVFLTVTVIKPTSVTATKNFTLRTAATNHVPANVNCSIGQPGCEPPPQLSPVNLGGTTPSTTLQFPVRLYQIGVAGNVELPCIQPCPPTGDTFRFELPPRPAGNQAPQRFRTMTMIGQVPGLWPTNTGAPAPPYADGVIASVDFTGLISPNVQACSQFRGFTNQEGEFVVTGCNQRATYTPYRALTSASLQFASDTTNTFATAPTLQLPFILVGGVLTRGAGLSWSTTEGALP